MGLLTVNTSKFLGFSKKRKQFKCVMEVKVKNKDWVQPSLLVLKCNFNAFNWYV